MRLLFLLLFSLPGLCFLSSRAEGPLQKENKESPGLKDTPGNHPQDSSKGKEKPVIPGDFADPSLIRRGNVYYATGTSSEWAPHFPLFRSTDLLHWQPIGYVFNRTPSWAAGSFWAPELFYRKGTYYVY